MTLDLILILSTIIFIHCKTRPLTDRLCIAQNVWQSISDSTKLIGDPKKCTSISKDCCFIKINYVYLNTRIDSEYCASLTGTIEDFKKFLINTYADDLLFYANSTYYDFGKFIKIGRNLNSKYYDAYRCNEPATSSKQFSTYLEQNCGKFDPDTGNCLEEKDTEYFNQFLAKFYQNFTDNYCNKRDEDKKCIYYNGTHQNNAMVRPLLMDLVGYLHINDPNYESDDGNVDIEQDTSKEWPNTTACLPRSPIEVEVICPEGYVKGVWINRPLLYLLMMIVIILI